MTNTQQSPPTKTNRMDAMTRAEKETLHTRIVTHTCIDRRKRQWK